MPVHRLDRSDNAVIYCILYLKMNDRGYLTLMEIMISDHSKLIVIALVSLYFKLTVSVIFGL